MENHQYLNQKIELSSNQKRLNSPFNKNNQIPNFFRWDSNIIKTKNKIYNMNSTKEIHFTSRPKGEELNLNGPKILTINFPPEFILSNNNPRKNSSQEKNRYLKNNLGNDMELNDKDKNNGKFASTVKKDFEKLKGINSNIDINNNKKNLILINLNKKHKKKNKVQKKNFLYIKTHKGLSSSIGLSSNIGYSHSERELSKRRRKSSDNKKKFIRENETENYDSNHIKTEGSNYEFQNSLPNETINQINYKLNSKRNLNKPLNFHIYCNQNCNHVPNIEIKSNTYNNNNNSKEKILNNYLSGTKNIFILGNSSNKLIFNPSSINKGLKNINSEFEYDLHLGKKIYGKEFDNNYKYYNYINEPYKNIAHFNSESHCNISTSREQNPNSYNKEKYYIKTQTVFDNKINFPKHIINEIESIKNKEQKNNQNINSAAEYNKNILENFSIKKKLENINIGIAYKVYNGYKFYFNLPNEQIYILKEVSYSCGKGLIPQIELWNKKYQNDSTYLKIYDHEINFNQRQIIWIMQYPIGGESINDIINSVGFYDQNYLFDLVNKIYRAIVKLKEDKDNDKYKNVPFCICDIFINVNEHIKIIPPLIRQIPIDSNLDKKNNNNIYNKYISPCKCKKNLMKIMEYFKEESYSFLCLGLAIIQTITQNLIFDMSSYKYTLNQLKNSKKNIFKEYCCLVHLLLNIEQNYFNGGKYLLFRNFLKFYPKSLLTLLHECTNFKNNNVYTSNEFLNLYDTDKNLNLSIKEVLDITCLPENDYIKFDTFISDFEILFKGIKVNPEIYLRKLNSNKVIHVLSRAFGLDKEIFMNKLKEKIGIKFSELNKYDNKDKYDISENENSNNEIGIRNNFLNDIISSLFIGFNKKKREINDNIFNKQNHSELMNNYIQSN